MVFFAPGDVWTIVPLPEPVGALIPGVLLLLALRRLR